MTVTAIANPTKNTLAEDVRGQMVNLLQATLADAIDLQLAAKQAHWNVKGKSFIALHQLFDDLFAQATDWVDLQAERLVQLGGVADGAVRSVAARSRQPEYPSAALSGEDHVEAVSAALSAFGTRVREGIQAAADAGDDGTADLYTEVVRAADKMLWFVEAHAH